MVSDSKNNDQAPLVVDLDGTLIRTDLLVESAFGLLSSSPMATLDLPRWLCAGRARLKAELAKRVPLDATALPYDETVLEHLRAERAAGRPIWLASAADRRYVEAIAAHLGLFDGVFASGGERNLKAGAKATTLVDAFGAGGFDYIGNHADDLPIWDRARRVLLVDVSDRVQERATDDGTEYEVLVPKRVTPTAWLRAMRPHQWLKNLLVFVPMVAAHEITLDAVGLSLLAFVAFSLVASGVYVLNDLLDLSSDRAHPRKSTRPFASGALPVQYGPILAGGLVLAGSVIAASTSGALLVVLAVYLVLTTLYSIHLKRKALLDVITLAGLYTLRVLGGGAAVGIVVSEWLLAFSMFLFLALAIIKRHAELVDVTENERGDPAGRGYQTRDLSLLETLGAASGYSSVLVLALYVNTPQVQQLYSQPAWLWGVCGLLLYWISSMLMASHRGQLDDDPLVYAATDRTSLIVLALCGVLVLVAT